ncbi:MAG: M81 family metallopeptidase [Bacillota bacterium]|nr:M81 family metallopeptidase [Bacillota bacterium]
MKIAVGSLMHETNTFTAKTTPLVDFNTAEDVVFQQAGWMGGPAGGILETLSEAGCSIIPTFFASAMPSGIIEGPAYQLMKQKILAKIENTPDLDGVCLALHGSMFAEDIDDPEGDLLTVVRRLIGPVRPMVCSLDMHATLTESMVRAVNGLTVFRTAPHTDTYETGARAARMLLRILQDRLSARVTWVRLPMLLAGEQSESDTPPMSDLIALVRQAELDSHILAADYTLGFPWADTPHHGIGVAVTAEDRFRSQAASMTQTLAHAFWKVRQRFNFTTEAYPLDIALAQAAEFPGQPVIIGDSGDNPTAGASEDLSYALKVILSQPRPRTLHAAIVDPAAVERCRAAGAEHTLSLDLGRISDAPKAPPLRVRAYIVKTGLYGNAHSAVLDIGGVSVIITDRKVPVHDPALIEQLGIDLQTFKIIVIKSGYLSPEYKRLAVKELLALTPGDTNEQLDQVAYRRTLRPIYPLDRETTWP